MVGALDWHGDTGGRAQWERVEEDEINFGYTGLENPLRNLSRVQKANGFINRELRCEIRDEMEMGAIRIGVKLEPRKEYKIIQGV